MTADDPFDPRRGGWRTAGMPVLLAGVWLVYLVQPLQQILAHPAGLWRVAGVVAIGVFSLAYVLVFFQLRRRRWSAVSSGSVVQAFALDRVSGTLVVVMLICFASMVPSAGSASLDALVYLVATLMMITPLSFGWAVSVGAVVATEVAAGAVPGWGDARGTGLAILLASVAVFGMRMALRRSQQLAAAREDLARLAVQEERHRFARDLHDILGHSLTVVTMKAELAGRLLHVDADSAGREIADVERLAREALADVRAAVAGYRGITLAGELVNARAALRAAGIAADLPTAIEDVPGERRALFGWVVREGVTNVVRHSGARRCTVTVAPDAVEVLDDGHGGPIEGPSGDHGHGLLGLRERAHALSGQLRTFSSPEGFLLRVELPGLSVVPEPGPGAVVAPDTEGAGVGDGAASPDAPGARFLR